jgi:hypothetical protein
MPIEEFRRHCGEAIQLPPLCCSTPAGFIDLGVNSLANQLKPRSRLLPGLLEGDRSDITERSPRRMAMRRPSSAAPAGDD